MSIRKSITLLLLAALPLLAGSQCTFIFSSGGSDDDKDEDKDKEGLLVVVRSGEPSATAVAGVAYRSGDLSGVTDDNGRFRYEPDQPVSFAIGDIPLGDAVEGAGEITPSDLAAGSPDSDTAAANIGRLLRSLDGEPGDDRITIPASVRAEAVLSNGAVSAAIEYLDYADGTGFTNAASHLVAVLTRNYPFTAVLVEGDGTGGEPGKEPK